MKKFFIFIILFFLFLSAFSSIHVEYNDDNTSEQLQTIKISNVEYFNVYELNKVFGAIIQENILDNNLEMVINGKKIFFLLNASYAILEEDIYNFTYPLILHKNKYYLPVNTLAIILPKIQNNYKYFPDKNVIKTSSNISSTISKIVVDPGHGGKDPGAIGYRSKEKDIVLKFANILKRKLEKNLDVEVVLTRSKDEFISLKKRTDIANLNNADMFISIHCNASVKKAMSGVEVFFLSTTNVSDQRAMDVMEFENSVVEKYEGIEAQKEYDALSFILSDMKQNEFLKASQELANNLQKNLVKETSFKDRGVRQAGFYVLKGAFMPSVLVELGFITNKKEELKILSNEYRDKMIQALINGVATFKKNYEKL